jgi:hypothetical protein
LPPSRLDARHRNEKLNLSALNISTIIYVSISFQHRIHSGNGTGIQAQRKLASAEAFNML